MFRHATSRSAALLTALALVAAACGSGTTSGPVSVGEPAPAPTAAETTAAAAPAEPEPEPTATTDADPEPLALDVAAGVNQIAVLSSSPGLEITVSDGAGVELAGTTDDFGSLLFRDVAAGVYRATAAGAPVGEDLNVVDAADSTPDPSFHTSQEIGEGFGYLTTRDGTTLSVNVILPTGEGPFPTVIEYSGYDPSNPLGADIGLGSIFGPLGYAYVGVNMRGTGCSGGSFEFFEPMQLLDGYDMVEAIAAQPWVLNNEVGLVGVSYPGISQLFVASTRPPSLAAITPLSVLDDSTKSTLYPGGILNTGFAKAWSDEREAEAAPYGQGWEQEVVDGGDTTCADNQLLRLQNTDAAALIDENAYYTPELGDPIAPHLLVGSIDVPVFLAGAWQDEQTGGHFPAMLDDFTSSPALYATIVNGGHIESVANVAIFERYIEFLELYVARRTPNLNAAGLVAAVLTTSFTGTSATLPTGNRFADLSYEEALAAYEAEAGIRVLFESGAAEDLAPGAPASRFEASFSAWPIPEAVATTWYLTPDGALSAEPVATASEPSSYVSDPDNVPAVFFDGPNIWAADATYDWVPIPAGTGLAWTSEPLGADTVVVGSGSLDLWLRSSAEDTDVEVTVSEVRPDGTEVYVQSGWLRASQRAVDEDASSPNRPVHTHLEADAAPLPAGEFSELRVEIFPFGHAFRAGSSIRVTVDAPGGARPLWAFDNTIAGGETNEVTYGPDQQSRLVLQVVPGVEVPAGLPTCGALRSQPCRPFAPEIGTNG